MLPEQIISRLNDLVDQNRECILNVADFIWEHPETGYREWKTSAFLSERFIELGYKPILMGNIPGFYADIDTGRPGPVLAVIGELDSVICASHPDADPETGAVHACGHHSQSAYLAGAAAVLRDNELLSSLCGKLRFVAVPAEELIELAYRASLRDKGIIKYFGGKIEFLYRGVFDGVDAAVMIHSGNSAEKSLSIDKGNNGCMAKNITFIGKAAHAGGAPHKGINALYAASLGLQAINSIRETFEDGNVTRVHPIITEGGAAVNVIPEIVRLESFVRGATKGAIVSENKRVNRALAGAALSIGARIRVRDIPGYMPLHNDEYLSELIFKAGAAILGDDRVERSDSWGAGSTDMGDLSCVMPVAQPGGGGGAGTGHGEDYRIADSQIACLDSARCMVGFIYVLLSDGGARLYKVKEQYKPEFASYGDYFTFVDALYADRELVAYDGDSAAVVW